MADEHKLKHLEMLQNIISRMANNSFYLKGWSVVIVSALFALNTNNRNTDFILLAYFPACAFWILNGFFLWQERLFRKLYDKVRIKEEQQIDFSMDTSPVKNEVKGWFATIFADTITIFHLAIISTITIAFFVLKNARRPIF